MQQSALFTPLRIRGVELRNRVWVSPMCMYSSVDGLASDFHMTHIGQYALGGAGLILMEATGVVPEGRITPSCLGLWSDSHAQALSPVVDFAKKQGAKVAIQLAHAGRKASANPPHAGPGFVSVDEGGWTPVGPTNVAFRGLAQPQAATEQDLANIISGFAHSAQLAVAAGFDVVEIHGAHGYLLHQFASPLVNTRNDEWGGTGRTRLACEVARAVRDAIPDSMPLLYRVSATDWVDGGWTLEDSCELAESLKNLGVDMIDVSSGGAVPDAQIPVGPGYQVPLAKAIRQQAGILTAAVGMISDAESAQRVLTEESADAVMMGRRWLRDPYSALHFAEDLAVDVTWPRQYARR
jgi:2,4-dienoyl-CoA reductase-like NADH-dependent reductase (Old Yellow Enzyme family)